MRILLTNDDGYAADGIKALQASLGGAHEVWLFAPESERSGMSHAMSLRHPIKTRKLAEREYSCSGTPAELINDPRVKETYLGNTFRGDEFGPQKSRSVESVAGESGGRSHGA